MATVNSILVDIDACTAHHPALGQAVSLATRCGAPVRIVDVVPLVPRGVRHFVTAERERDLVEHRREQLSAIAGGMRGVGATIDVLRGRPGTALIQEVLRSPHDLLVRSHGRDEAGSARPFGAIDMELLRQCRCPVWLVAGHAAHRPWRILAAIHANAEEEVEQTLNGTILDWASTLTNSVTRSSQFSRHGRSTAGVSSRSHMPHEEFAEVVEDRRRREEDALARCVNPFSEQLKSVPLESVYGDPEDVIDRFVESHGIDVVVMGTVARTGVAGLVMGNTAERVLRRLRGSVLAVKPPGFQTPVAQAVGAGERK